MPIFVAVVGQRDAGKSTIIRSLTGCETRGYRGFVQDSLTGQSIYVVCSSPQEDPLHLEALRIVLSDAATREHCRGVVMAIQPSEPRVRLRMEEILDEASGRGYQIHVFVIDPVWSGEGAAASQSGATGLGTLVEERLRARGIGVRVLDGRRFSLMNAQEINEITHIVT